MASLREKSLMIDALTVFPVGFRLPQAYLPRLNVLMSDLERTLAALGASVEERLDQLRWRLRGRTGFFKNIEILPFRGFGTSSEVFMEGRVLQETGLRTPLDNDRVWQNIAATYRRFHTVELPGAIVEAEYHGTKSRFIADEEGYFKV